MGLCYADGEEGDYSGSGVGDEVPSCYEGDAEGDVADC